MFRFKVVDASSMDPVKGIRGEYSVSQRESSPWKSNNLGEVFLEHLTVGLTNIQINKNAKYFDQAINGAKVEKQPGIAGSSS